MASIRRMKSGSYRIQFTNSNKKRKAVYLSGVTLRNAEIIQRKIERIVESQVLRQPMDRCSDCG